MALPELSTSTISSVVDGSRNLFSTGITQGLSAQIEALRGRGRVLWAWELDEANDGALSSSREKLLLQCPIAAPANNDTNNTSVRVWSYIAHSSGTHTLRYEVRDLFGALITQGTIGSYSATAWDSDVIDIGDWYDNRVATSRGRVLFIYGVTTGSGSVVALTVHATNTTGGSPSAPVKMSVTHQATGGESWDARSLQWARDSLNMVARRYPRTLAAHSFDDNTASRTSPGAPTTAEKVRAFYKVWRGPNVSSVEVGAYVSRTNNSGTAPVGTMEAFVDGVSAGTANLTSTTGAWATVTCSAGLFTANTVHEIRIDCYAAYNATTESVTVYDVYGSENAYTATDFQVNSTNRIDSPATRAYAPSWPLTGTGANVIANVAETTNYGITPTRASVARSVIATMRDRSACLFADRLGQQPGTSTSSKGASSTQLAQTIHYPTPGHYAVDVFVCAHRVGITDEDLVPVMRVSNDTDTTDASEVRIVDPDGYSIGGTLVRRWYYVGRVPVVADGTATTLTIRGGWVNALTGAAAAATDPVALDGVFAVEVPYDLPPAQQYHYTANTYSASNSIPDNDVVTGLSKSITVSEAFDVRLVRVYVAVSHGTPTQLIYKLSDGTTSVTFRAAGTAGNTATWWSDATGGVIGDANTSANLSAFIGAASNKTWTLTVYDDTAGTTGTLTAFRLELW